MEHSDVEWDGIIRGGPFLELSFLLPTAGKPRVTLLEHFLATLGNLKLPMKMIQLDEHPSIMLQFQEGYPFDSEDPDSIIIHKAEFSLVINFPEERKSRIYVEEIASETLQFDFAFFGSRFDAPEWHQIGISLTDEPKFLTFFEELYRVYKFPLGTMGYEIDCLALFPEYEPWPNEMFQVDKFDPAKMPENPAVDVVLWKGKYLKNAYSPNPA